MKLPQEPARAIELCAKAGLSEKDTRIFMDYYYPNVRLVKVEKTKTLRELGDEYHISAEAIRQRLEKSLKKIEKVVREV